MSQTTGVDLSANIYPRYSERQMEAVRELKKAIRADPDSAELYAELAEICEDARDWNTAIAAYRQAIRCDPENPDYYEWLGSDCEEAGRWEEAVEAYRSALRLDPDYDVYQRHLAEALVKAGRHEEAVTSFCQLLRFAPDDAGPSDAKGDDGPEWGVACGYLALLLRRAGLLDEVAARLREAVRRAPELGVFE